MRSDYCSGPEKWMDLLGDFTFWQVSIRCSWDMAIFTHSRMDIVRRIGILNLDILHTVGWIKILTWIFSPFQDLCILNANILNHGKADMDTV
jgi:hypothetical protein